MPLTPDKLIGSLQELVPLNVTLHKNLVGNLAVKNVRGAQIGYVDLQSGEVDLYAREEHGHKRPVD